MPPKGRVIKAEGSWDGLFSFLVGHATLSDHTSYVGDEAVAVAQTADRIEQATLSLARLSPALRDHTKSFP